MIRHLCRGRLPFAVIVIAIWAALGMGQSGAAAAQPSAVPAAAPAETIRMDHISVEVIGHGNPVILVPGLSTPRAVWDGVAPGLAESHSVYLVQVNGFGGDDPGANLQPGVLDGIVADLHALIAGRRLEKPALVGHSMGGLAGLMLAKAHPDDLGRLMVVDALPFIGTLFVPGSTAQTIEPQAKMMRDRFAAGHGQPMADSAAQAIAASNALKPESRAKVAAWVRATDMRVTALAVYEDMTTDLRADMAGIGTPVTLLYPSSAMLPKERADALYRGEYAAAPHMTFVPVADSGHFIMLDQPDAFRAALEAFLK